MWDLRCTKWHWSRVPPSTSVSHTNSYSTNSSTLIYYHPWPTYQVEAVSYRHTEERKKLVRRWPRHSGCWQRFTVHFHPCVPLYAFTTDIIIVPYIPRFRVRTKILTAEKFLCSTMLSSFSCNLLNIYAPCQFRIPASICISSWCIANCIRARITELVNYFNDVNVAER